jgi:hypothetical protein
MYNKIKRRKQTVKKYESPVMEAEILETLDVINTSATGDGKVEEDNSGTLPDMPGGFGF